MAGLEAPQHSPVGEAEEEGAHIAERNSRNGLWLFFVYLAIYGSFVGLSAFAVPSLMATPVLAGVNLAIVFGFGLIVSALVLAAIYMYLCRPSADASTSKNNSSGSGSPVTGEGKALDS